ncbi:MAG: hypothetical protein AAF281_13350 [Pseudomonadota bacterium]
MSARGPKKALSAFMPVPHQTALWSAQSGDLRCTALRLCDGSLCLYSPVAGLGGAARDSLAALGDVSVLFAPNHYHNKGLVEYRAAFPGAQLMCSARARPRLEKQTGLSFCDSDLRPLLSEGFGVSEPEGLKTGEVWLECNASAGPIWVVCDAFRGPAGPLGHVGAELGLLGTFPNFGIQDRATYRAWVNAKLASGAPSIVVPCHGAVVEAQDLAETIAGLLA